MGVGTTISASVYDRRKAGKQLRDLMESQTVKRSCLQIRARFDVQNVLQNICDVIEAVK
jgi:hypothetical protein